MPDPTNKPEPTIDPAARAGFLAVVRYARKPAAGQGSLFDESKHPRDRGKFATREEGSPVPATETDRELWLDHPDYRDLVESHAAEMAEAREAWPDDRDEWLQDWARERADLVAEQARERAAEAKALPGRLQAERADAPFDGPEDLAAAVRDELADLDESHAGELAEFDERGEKDLRDFEREYFGSLDWDHARSQFSLARKLEAGWRADHPDAPAPSRYARSDLRRGLARIRYAATRSAPGQGSLFSGPAAAPKHQGRLAWDEGKHPRDDRGRFAPHEMTRAQLIANHQGSAPNNSMTPWEGKVPPVGTWRMDERTGELEQLRQFDPADLALTEGEGSVRNRDDYRQYVEWARQGRTPPPIDVVKHADGGLISSNRRRVMAAKEAGVKAIHGWFSDTLPNGRPAWTHEGMIRAALAAGKPVPPEVLADYPDLAPKAAEKAQTVSAESPAPNLAAPARPAPRVIKLRPKPPEHRNLVNALGGLLNARDAASRAREGTSRQAEADHADVLRAENRVKQVRDVAVRAHRAAKAAGALPPQFQPKPMPATTPAPPATPRTGATPPPPPPPAPTPAAPAAERPPARPVGRSLDPRRRAPAAERADRTESMIRRQVGSIEASRTLQGPPVASARLKDPDPTVRGKAQAELQARADLKTALHRLGRRLARVQNARARLVPRPPAPARSEAERAAIDHQVNRPQTYDPRTGGYLAD